MSALVSLETIKKLALYFHRALRLDDTGIRAHAVSGRTLAIVGEGSGSTILLGSCCLDLLRTDVSYNIDRIDHAVRTLKAIGSLFGLASFSVSVTSRLKGP